MNTFCVMCGKPLVPGARFCPECGAGITAVSSAGNAPASSVAPMSGNSSGGVGEKTTLVTCAAIGSFLWAAVMAFVVLLQLGLAATTENGELAALGYWNLVIVAAYVVIGIGILTRKRWAWSWGIGSNTLNLLFGIYQLTQGVRVDVLFLPIELFIVIALYATRSVVAPARTRYESGTPAAPSVSPIQAAVQAPVQVPGVARVAIPATQVMTATTHYTEVSAGADTKAPHDLPVSSTVSCSKCGNPLVPGKRFCPDCGVGIAEATSSAPAASPVAPEPNQLERLEHPKRFGLRKVLLSVGVLVVFALVSGALFIWSRSTIKPIWTTTNSQSMAAVVAAAGGAATPASTIAATPSAQTAPSIPEDDKYVATVRGGILSAPYNTTTIGKAFEATFTNWKWESKESDKGARFVEFTGRLKPDAYKETFDRHKKCIDSAEARHDSAGAVFGCSGEFGGWAGTAEFRHAHTDAEIEIAASTATFRFIFDATNDSSFGVGYVDTDPWANVAGFPDNNSSQEWILGYIYK